MTAAKANPTAESGMEKALKELSSADMTRAGGDTRRLAFMKLYKGFDAEARKMLCDKSAEMLKERFHNAQRLEGMLTLLASGFAAERDWESAIVFLNSVLDKSSDAEFFRELALVLLEISDNQLTDKHHRIPVGQTILVLLTEFGLLLAGRSGQSALDRDAVRVVEYITTNLLARSNMNNNAMRISLVHYLASCPLTNQGTMQLNRVISRFGQSLLDDMLTAYFEDKRKGNAAFFFLVEHLNSFFAASPALAEMSHNVLKHFMLKFPGEFPPFLASYSDFVAREETSLRLAAKHMALLFRAAHDVSQKALAETIGKILLKHLSLFADVSDALLNEQIELVSKILLGPSKNIQNAMFELFLKDVAALSRKAADAKVVPLAKIRKSKETVVKPAKIGEKPSPLEAMLALAS